MSRFIRTLGYFTLGLGASLIVGYWLKQEELRTRSQVQPIPIPPPPSDETVLVLSQHTLDAAPVVVADPPQKLEATAHTDDLTQINGIGTKTALRLQEIGITTFVQLANSQADDLLPKLGGIRGINREKVAAWIEQAAHLGTS